MEKRAILAAVLMAALLVLYQTFFSPVSPPEKAAPKQGAEAPSAPATPAPPAATAPALPRAAEAARPAEQTARIEAPLYEAAVSSDGGKLTEWRLTYRGHKPLVVPGELGPLGLVVAGDPTAPGTVVPMTLSPARLTLGAKEGTQTLTATGAVNGLRVTERKQFQGDAYSVGMTVRVENTTGAARTISVALPWVLREPWKDPAEKFNGQRPTELVWSTSGRIDREPVQAAIGNRAFDGEWVGMDSVWYLTALVPRSPGFRLFAMSEGKLDAAGKGSGQVSIGLRATPRIEAGQAWEGQAVLYVGPKEYERLRAQGLEGTLNFGGFPVPRKYGGLPMEWLGVPILLLLKWVERFVGNYGVAIIILTIVSKVLFYPLTVKSMRSMRAMQVLQPQVNSLRAKFKDDPQRLQRETLELYRKYKVNPMGGCLPMVAQIPIFYALYLALSVSVELQNAPFICFGRVFGSDLWICDLAGRDPTYVLPILMGISMFVQQKMTPVAGDPRQARMMLVMPFVFTFMFLNLPSGLVLYWFVSNVLQVLQQWWMERGRVKEREGGKHGSRA